MENSLRAIQQLGDFGELDGRKQVETIVFALCEFDAARGVQPAQIKAVFEALHFAPYSRISQYLSEAVKTGRGKTPRFLKSALGYRLVASVKSETEKRFSGRPSKKVIQKHLEDHLDKMPTQKSKDYLSEALGCFTHNFWRASIVMTWCLAFDHVRSYLFDEHLEALNSKFSARRSPFTISKIEDFEVVGERDLIDTARAVGALTKETHKTLVHLLDDRNSFAHPSGKPITASIAEAYIERSILEIINHIK